MLRVFISSVQKELADARRAVKEFITRDPLLSRFVCDVFLFEANRTGMRHFGHSGANAISDIYRTYAT
jgi:hypothetical protein